jgi:predicted phage tail protein
MTTVNIEGHLGRVFGSVWNLQVSTFRELFSAMEANSKNLRSYLHQNKKEYWAIFVDGERVESDKFLQSNIKDKKVKIIPILAGAAAALAGFLVAQLGIQSAFIVGLLEFVLTVLISAAISFGISMLMAKLLSTNDPEAMKTTSFLFTSAENTSEQGQVVPVGYGRIKVGSKVISVAASNIDKGQWERWRQSDFEVNIPVVGTDLADILIDGAKMSTDRIRTG